MRRSGLALVIIGTAAIGALTLLPDPAMVDVRPDPLCLLCGERSAPDLVLNVLLFLPLGLGLGLRGTGLRRALMAGLLLSAGIELAQTVIPGRSPSAQDLLANGLGAWIGALIALRGPAWLLGASPRRMTGLLWGAALLVPAAVATTGMLLRVAPRDGALFVHWAPRQAHLEPWTGQVHRVTLAGASLPFGRTDDPAMVRTAILRGDSLVIDATAGRPTRRVAGLFSISDERQWEVLLVGQLGQDLVLREQRASDRLKLYAPNIRLPGAFAGLAEGAPLHLSVAEDEDGRSCVTINGARTCAPRFAAGSAWALFQFEDRWTGRRRLLLDAVTFAGLLLPFGLALAGAPARARGPALALLIVAVPAVAYATGLALPSLHETLAGAAGTAIGACLWGLRNGSSAERGGREQT